MSEGTHSLAGKVVLITGGSSGIGLALAESFGKAGAKVAITGRTVSSLDKAIEGLMALGVDAIAIKADVKVMADCEDMVVRCLQKWGRLDILINNAGISMRALFDELDLTVIREVMEVNFFGAVQATKAALPAIKSAKGSIIAISSIAGIRGLPARTGYSASKGALNLFVESLRTELIDDGVHVLLASPGFTASNIRKAALQADGTPQGTSPLEEGKIMPAEEVADRILRATIARKRDILMTQEGKLVRWLNQFWPSLVDTLVLKKMKAEKDAPWSKRTGHQ